VLTYCGNSVSFVNSVDFWYPRLMSRRKRPGRTPGSPPNREAILRVARRQFVEHGYEGTTIRRIAAEAGVDPALVVHYFGSKPDLILAALQPAAESAFNQELPDRLDGLGASLLRATLTVHDTIHEPGTGGIAALIRAAAVHEGAARLLREGAAIGQIKRLFERLGLDQAELRAALVASELYGLAIARFIARIEPIASANEDVIVEWYAPAIQRRLTEPLGTRQALMGGRPAAP
jgi:AcrR family transcriptional regulator